MRPKSRSGPAPYERQRCGKWNGSIWSVPTPVLIRIYKEDSTFEVWKQDRSGNYALLNCYRSASSQEILDPS